jgi:hypothetical protein
VWHILGNQRGSDIGDNFNLVLEQRKMSKKKLKAALEMACREVEYLTGSCPADRYDWYHPDGCEVICNEIFSHKDPNMSNCWKLYFKERAGDE